MNQKHALLRSTSVQSLCASLAPSLARSSANCCAERQFHGAVAIWRQRTLREAKADLQQLAQEIHLSAALSGRIKTLDSTWHKMRLRQLSYLEILDVIGVRIILENVDDCYRMLERVHSHYTQIPGQQRDYIASPKANGYQSLHTTVRNAYGEVVEVQLRTHLMHERSEHGAAAHRQYKSDALIGLVPGDPTRCHERASL